MTENPGISRMANIQAQFQHRQKLEKERKLQEILDLRRPPVTQNGGGYARRSSGPGVYPPSAKVRQQFEERRAGNGMTPTSTNSYRNGGYVGREKTYPMQRTYTGRSCNDLSVTRRASPGPRPPTTNPGRREFVRGVPPKSRGTSVERSIWSGTSSGSSTSSQGSFLRRSSSSQRFFSDENANETPEYYEEDFATRELGLRAKLRNMTITRRDHHNPPHQSQPQVVQKTPPIKKSDNRVGPLKVKARSRSPTAMAPNPATRSGLQRSGPPPSGLEECRICGRCFANDRIEKHEGICKKTAASSKKRKIFNPTKMRMQGTEAEGYLRTVLANEGKPTPPTPNKSDWRKKHEDFISTIRAAKDFQKHVDGGGNPADLPPPPPSDTSDYIQCGYCGRRFNEQAASRHIPKCREASLTKR